MTERSEFFVMLDGPAKGFDGYSPLVFGEPIAPEKIVLAPRPGRQKGSWLPMCDSQKPWPGAITYKRLDLSDAGSATGTRAVHVAYGLEEKADD